jgi:hypothetical protein
LRYGDTARRERVFWHLLTGAAPQVTEDDLAYFRDHPDEIDEVTAPLNVHKLFLWVGALLGMMLVAVSKWLAVGRMLAGASAAVREFAIDIVFESGVALIGAAITAFLLGILLNKQQENAALWRAEIRRRLGYEDAT